MTAVRIAAKNTLVFAAMRVAQYLLLFVFSVVAARYLGVRDFGTLTFGLAFTGLLGVTADFGLGRLANREIARDRSRMSAIVDNSMLLKVLLSGVYVLLIVLVINLLRYPPLTRQVVYLLALSVVFAFFELFLEGVFKGVERMEYQAYSATSDKLLTCVIGLGLLLSGQGLLMVACAFVVARLLALALALAIYGRKLARPGLAADRSEMAWLLREAWPFAVFALLATSYLQFDTVLLSQVKGSVSVGIYQAAMRLVLVLMIIPEAVSEATFPGMARLFHSSRERLKVVYQRCLKLMWVTGLPLTALLCLMADRIVVSVYGKPYSGGVPLLEVMALMVLPRFLAYVPGTLLTAIDQQQRRTAVAGLCVVVSVVSNLLLVPRAGAQGAAVATIITSVTLYGACALLTRAEGFVGVSWVEVLRPVAATALLALFLHSLRTWSPLLLVPGGILVYLLALHLLGGISEDDKQVARQCLARPGAGEPEVRP